MIVSELLAKLGIKIDSKSFKEGNAALTILKAGIAGLVSGAAVAGLVNFMNGVSNAADAAVKTAAKLGITAEAVQELGYAAEASDLSREQLSSGLSKLGMNLREVARTGKGPAAEALWALKVPLSSLKKLSPDQQLARLSKAFEKLPDGAKKSSIATKLFGKSLGTAFIPLLNSGADGIKELRDDARNMGVVVSTQVAQDFEAFNDNQTELATTWRGIKTQIAVGLLPLFSKMVTRVKEWLRANREVIASGLEKFVKGLLDAASFLSSTISTLSQTIGSLGFILEGVTSAIATITSVIDWFRQASDLANSILIGLGITLALYFGPAAAKAIIVYFIQLAAAATGTVAPLLATGAAAALVAIKFILIAAAIAALVYGLTFLIKHPDKVKKAFKVAWEFIKDKADWLWQKLKGIGQSIADFFTETIPDGIKRAFRAALDWVVNLPVIKQLIDLIEYVAKIPDRFTPDEGVYEAAQTQGGDPFVPASGDPFAQTGRQAFPPMMPQIPILPDTNATSQVNTFGDVNVTVNAAPGQSEKGIGEAAARTATDAQKRMLADAHSRMRGGHR